MPPLSAPDVPSPSPSTLSFRQSRVLTGRYIFQESEILGVGASATVYKGLDKQECRNVAIKMYKVDPDDPSGLDAFVQSVTVFEALSQGTGHVARHSLGASSDTSAKDIDAIQEEIAQVCANPDSAMVRADSAAMGRADSAGIVRYKTDGFLRHLDVRCCFVKLLDYSKTEGGKPGLDPADDVLFLVFELGDESLEETITSLSGQGSTLPLKELRKIQWTLVSMVWGLHAAGYVHLDIKPKNVMRFGTGSSAQWKLIDLDGAVPSGSTQPVRSLTFTPEYMPPELASALLSAVSSPVGKVATIVTSRLMDVWSVGMCMLEVVFLQPVLAPFYKEWNQETGNDMKYFRWLSDMDSEPIISGDMMSHIVAIHPDMADLLADMLNREPRQRCSIGRCLTHKWFDPVREKTMAEIKRASVKGHVLPTKVCSTM
mmetsp:Transcript_20906/g.60314  ORF Transcript_20906/g.60314 Transcript_20906/m.60314 type:complete len:429 (+) Transcript_20906:155-1441(+)